MRRGGDWGGGGERGGHASLGRGGARRLVKWCISREGRAAEWGAEWGSRAGRGVQRGQRLKALRSCGRIVKLEKTVNRYIVFEHIYSSSNIPIESDAGQDCNILHGNCARLEGSGVLRAGWDIAAGADALL